MFDPLASSPFAEDNFNPPWPTTPHPPNSPIPNLRPAPNSPHARPLTPDSAKLAQSTVSPPNSAGFYGKEPQIYGQPDQGLISPQTSVATNGTKYEKPEPYLRARITMLDRNRRDILVKFDAQTNLPNFTGTTYRNISRSYAEFQQFYESIVYTNPQTIVPALPLAQTSAPTDEEDDRLVKIMLQRWLTRICEDPFLMREEETRSFIESDFGYQPTPRSTRRKTGSGFSLLRRGVPDEDEALQKARFELTKSETQFFDAAKAIDKLARVQKGLSVTEAEMGSKLVNVASTETHQPLGNALRKIGRTWHSLSDLDQAESISECVIIGDTLGYQGLNARSAKETLLQRTAALEEYQQAVKTTISKRRHIERLKASTNIKPDRVDEALEDMEEADKYEQILSQRVNNISQNLHVALKRHNKLVQDDITAALVEHARNVIMYERQRLRELEALRTDIANADKKVVPVNGLPRPAYIPKLDEDLKPQPKPVPPPVAVSGPPLGGSLPSAPIRNVQAFHPPLPAALAGLPPASRLTNSASLPPQSPGAGPSSPPPVTPSPTTPFFARRDSVPPRPASAAASTNGPSTSGPPLGGRFVDGSKSMFINPSAASTVPRVSSPLHSSATVSVARPTTLPRSPRSTPPTASSAHFPQTAGPTQVYVEKDPLGPLGPSAARPPPSANTGLSSSMYSPLGPGLPRAADPLSPTASANSNGSAAVHAQEHVADDLDPLGNVRAKYMRQSMRVQAPARPRLDAREAASKLANLF